MQSPTETHLSDVAQDEQGSLVMQPEQGIPHITSDNGERPNAATLAVDQLLRALNVPITPGMEKTAARHAAALKDMLWGYNENPRRHLETTFPAPPDPGVIIQSGIDVQSVCEHHILPFGGHATVAYRPKPGQSIVGLSKLTRLVYGYAARAQVQERIGYQVATALMEVLDPAGALVIITADHSCMRLRGVRGPSSVTTTVAIQGTLTDADMALAHQLHSRGPNP